MSTTREERIELRQRGEALYESIKNELSQCVSWVHYPAYRECLALALLEKRLMEHGCKHCVMPARIEAAVKEVTAWPDQE